MSSGSESDDDYVPGEPEQLSEEESADEQTEKQYENELQAHKKRRAEQEQANKGIKKKRKTTNINKEIEIEKETEEIPIQDPEDEKKHEEDLWAKFLEGTETKSKPVAKQAASVPTDPVGSNKPQTTTIKEKHSVTDGKDDDKARERRIFEFAGETIVVENNVIKEKLKTPDTQTGNVTASNPGGPSKARGAGGLSSVLGQLNKKNTLSTLEKSKLDWSTYKREEGIEEEIQSHNKGKEGYLDRKDFLERADIRQYEIERDLRLSRRSNR